jgi:hypothetical protein
MLSLLSGDGAIATVLESENRPLFNGTYNKGLQAQAW